MYHNLFIWPPTPKIPALLFYVISTEFHTSARPLRPSVITPMKLPDASPSLGVSQLCMTEVRFEGHYIATDNIVFKSKNYAQH